MIQVTFNQEFIGIGINSLRSEGGVNLFALAKVLLLCYVFFQDISIFTSKSSC